MTLPGPTIDDLKAADRAARREGVPADVDARLRLALREAASPTPPPAPRTWFAPALGVAAAAAAVLVALWPSEGDVVTLAGFEVPAHCDVVADGPTLTVRGPCGWHLGDLGVQLSTRSGATVRQRLDGRTLVDAGDVTFDVDKRRPSQLPYEVQARGAVIVVHGTRFLVETRSTPGSVALEHGSIELRRPADAPVMMMPGDREPLARAATSTNNPASAQTKAQTTAEASAPSSTQPPALATATADAEAQRASRRIAPRSSSGAPPRAAPTRTELPRTGYRERSSPVKGAPSSKAPHEPPQVASLKTVDGAQLLADVARLRAVGSYPEALARVEELLSETRLAPRSRRVGLYERMSLLGRLDEPIDRRCAAIDAFLVEAEEADSRVARAQRERVRLSCP